MNWKQSGGSDCGATCITDPECACLKWTTKKRLRQDIFCLL